MHVFAYGCMCICIHVSMTRVNPRWSVSQYTSSTYMSVSTQQKMHLPSTESTAPLLSCYSCLSHAYMHVCTYERQL